VRGKLNQPGSLRTAAPTSTKIEANIKVLVLGAMRGTGRLIVRFRPLIAVAYKRRLIAEGFQPIKPQEEERF
jgi:hypothetical protein